MKKIIIYTFILAGFCLPALFAQYVDSVALSVIGTQHISSGARSLLSYDRTITNVNANWDGSTFTAPREGLFLVTVSFTKDPYFEEGTSDDVVVHVFHNDISCGYAWAGQTTSTIKVRSSASYTVSLSLNEGDTIKTYVDSDFDLKRNIRNYSLTIVMISKSLY